MSLFCVLSGVSACGAGTDASQGPQPLGSSAALSVVEVTTLTTVQSSAGIFLSPRPNQVLPPYVERGSAQPDVSFPGAASEMDRAKVDLALLFQVADGAGSRFRLDASLVSADDNAAPGVEHFFPALGSVTGSAGWPLELKRTDAATDGSSEWTGWRAYRGLAVHGQDASTLLAGAATLDYESLTARAPLLLGSDGLDMIVTNRSERAISNALLIYSHPGGIGIRAIPALAPGEQRVTTTGPKEGTADQQLVQARQALSDFFAESLGPSLGSAISEAKSIPFLETQGLRLVYLLEGTQLPMQVGFDQAVAEHRQVVISQGEVLLQADEAGVLSNLAAAPALDAASASSLLGRFTQAKLEFAAKNGDAQVRAESTELLAELASQQTE